MGTALLTGKHTGRYIWITFVENRKHTHDFSIQSFALSATVWPHFQKHKRWYIPYYCRCWKERPWKSVSDYYYYYTAGNAPYVSNFLKTNHRRRKRLFDAAKPSNCWGYVYYFDSIVCKVWQTLYRAIPIMASTSYHANEYIDVLWPGSNCQKFA